MVIPCDFYYYNSIVELEVRDGDTSGISLIVQDCFSYPDFLFFLKKLSVVLSRSIKNCVEILM